MSILYYGSHQLLIKKNASLQRMKQSTDFKQYKALVIKQLKNALGLPKHGKVEPMLQAFYRYDPEHIIIQNYLQQLEKYVQS